MICQTFRMIPQHFQNLAFSDTFARAFHDHALQLFLQGIEAFDPLFDLLQLAARDGIGLGAGLGRVIGKVQQFPNGPKREAELT